MPEIKMQLTNYNRRDQNYYMLVNLFAVLLFYDDIFSGNKGEGSKSLYL